MAKEIEDSYLSTAGSPNNINATADVAEIVVLELESFPAAVSVHLAEEKAGSAKPGAVKALAKAAKTILGSVGDVFKMTDFGNGVLAVVKEGLELVAGS